MHFPTYTRRVLALALCPVAAGAVALSSTATASAAPNSAAATHAAASAARNTSGLTTPVTGTVNGATQTGTLTITHFVRDGSQILAVGNLTLAGKDLGTVQTPVAVTDPPASCQVLHLDLAPLDLNLLGLVVHLNEVVLDISAQPGSGNLLGNLLCAVTGLLDNTGGANGGPLGGITALLNRILAAL